MNILELLSHHGVQLALSSVIMAFMLLNASSVLPLSGLNRLENSTDDVRLNVQIPGGLGARIAVIDMDDAYKNSVGHGLQSTGRLWSQDAIH